MTTTNITFHGLPGLRVAFVGDFTIREILDFGNGYKIHRWDVWQECDAEEVWIHSANTKDEAVLYVNRVNAEQEAGA